MSKKITNIVKTGILTLMLAVLTGCSSAVANDSKIESDLSEYFMRNYRSEAIESVEVSKRKTDKDNGYDYVWVNVASSDNESQYTKNFIISYMLYDEGGWQVTNIESDDMSTWSAVPINGVSTDDISNSLIGMNFDVDADSWNITPENLTDVVIEQQNTSPEQSMDSVDVSLNLDSDVMQAKGELSLDYKYDYDPYTNEGTWVIDSYDLKTPFTQSFIESKKLSVSNSDLTAILAEKTFIIGENSTEQVVTIEPEDVTNFTISDIQYQEKGTIQTINCNFDLNKLYAVLNIDAKIVYQYSKNNGWSAVDIFLEPYVKSVDIVGDWTGTYTSSSTRKLVLKITKFAADGTFLGTFNFSPSAIDPDSESGSYTILGGIDLKTLKVAIRGQEWIDRPSYYSFYDLDGYFSLDDGKIKGNRFEIAK